MPRIFSLLLIALFFFSCATVREPSPLSQPRITPEDETQKTITQSITAFFGTVIGGVLGYFAVQGNDDGTKTIISISAGAAIGTAAGWFLGGTIADEMQKHKTFDDTKAEEFMREYRMIQGR
ncbi:MAG TPA: hypothetical protein ENN55_05355 [Firmicutes bacterium]|nr:hypothetical protein [Bacillota bacterium]